MRKLSIFILLCICSGALAQSNNCLPSKIVHKQGDLEVKVQFYEYSKKGLVLKKTTNFSPINKGNYTESIQYTYNEKEELTLETLSFNGQVVSEKSFNYDSDGKVKGTSEKKNNLVKSTSESVGLGLTKKHFEDDGSLSLTEDAVYLPNGKVKSNTIKDKNNKSIILDKSEYTDAGLLSKKSHTDLLNNAEQIIETDYSKKDEKIEERIYSNGELVSKTIWTRPNNTKEIISHYNNSGQLQSETKITYNNKGNKETELFYYNGELNSQKEFTYSNNGTIEKEEFFDANKQSQASINYTYICNN